MILKVEDLWVFDGFGDDRVIWPEDLDPDGYRHPTVDELVSLVRKELNLHVEEVGDAYRYVTPWQYRRE